MGWLGTFAALIVALLLGGVGLGRIEVLQLHSYGVLVAIGFLIGIILAVREARRAGEDPERILDLAFWLLITAMIGARLLYVGLHWSEYAGDLSNHWTKWKVFRLWEGGLLFYGGFILALAVCWIFIRVYDMDFWKQADILIPSVAIGQFFGLLGSYAAAFGYGRPTENAWNVIYTRPVRWVTELPLNEALHPTQLYAALGVLFLFFLLLWLRSEKKFNGQVFITYLLIYPIISFGVELFRHSDDPRRKFLTESNFFKGFNGPDMLTATQALSIAVFVFAVFLWLNRTAAQDSK